MLHLIEDQSRTLQTSSTQPSGDIKHRNIIRALPAFLRTIDAYKRLIYGTGRQLTRLVPVFVDLFESLGVVFSWGHIAVDPVGSIDVVDVYWSGLSLVPITRV